MMRWALLLLLLPAGLASQAAEPALQVEGVGEPVSMSPAFHRGYAAFPAWTLRTLGARVEATRRGVEVVLAADTLHFEAGSPFFTGSGRTWQLVEPAYREGGVFYLPWQLFAHWLPTTFPDRVSFADGRLSLRATAREAALAGGDPPPGAAAAGPPQEPLGHAARVPVVVIDPGHGGEDTGRVGPGGLKEKDVVLEVSHRLARVLAERGYEVRMTRTTDTLVPLSRRAKMANEWRGNRPGLFLSIHANGVSNQRVRGFETFFLSEARTEDERRVAEMENAAIAYEMPDRVVGTEDLDFILNNLRNDYYVRASHTLAGLVQDQFTMFHSGPNRGVKQAGFLVLVGAFMPAVLIELGFISNPVEERLLGSASFQNRAVQAIADAVDRFFKTQSDLWDAST